MTTIITIILALMGACAASFFNAMAFRRMRGESNLKGRSKCPDCGADLTWFELIPIFSWLLVMGKCAACDEPISPRYLISELAGALAAALCFICFGFSYMTLLAFAVMVILVAISLFDLSTMEIPNGLIIAIMPLALLAVLAQPEIPPLDRCIGFFTANLPMLILSLFISGAFGGGDIKLMAVCGFLLGWQSTILAFFIAVVTAGCLAVSLMIRKKAKRGTKIPFGPHLCIGVAIAMLYGGQIIDWYLGFFLF